MLRISTYKKIIAVFEEHLGVDTLADLCESAGLAYDPDTQADEIGELLLDEFMPNVRNEI